MNYLSLIILAVVLLLAIAVMVIYNQLVKNKNRMQEAWSGMDVSLKKRQDLIPNLIETVKGYVAHEKQILEDITRYRTGAMQSKDLGARVQSETGLGNALNRLTVAVENYPDLKANSNFIEMQHQLADIEGELSQSRRYYNGTVRENNIAIESFPSNLIAGIFHFSKGEFFVIDTAGKEVPKVSF
jgi:LemA protein